MTPTKIDTRSWHWDRGTQDDLHILESPEGLLLRGVHGPVHYTLFANAASEVQWVKIIENVGGTIASQIQLERHAGLWWHKDGDPVSGSEDALDVDLACTAATNTLAIRRLALSPGQIADLRVLYIAVPGLNPRLVTQRYLRHRGGYSYENPETGFSARLTVDRNGWVRDYPGICRLSES